MDATKDSAQAFQGMLPLQPGNVEGNEKFPNFCLHADAQSSDDCDCNQLGFIFILKDIYRFIRVTSYYPNFRIRGLPTLSSLFVQQALLARNWIHRPSSNIHTGFLFALILSTIFTDPAHKAGQVTTACGSSATVRQQNYKYNISSRSSDRETVNQFAKVPAQRIYSCRRSCCC